MRVQGLGVLCLCFLVVMVVCVGKGEAQNNLILISCGTNSSINVDGRKWIGDLSLDKNVTMSSPGIDASTSTFNGDLEYASLYKNARFFTDRFNYTIQGVKGSYFLRLHFYPFDFENYKANDSYFSAEANGLKLVSELNVVGEIMQKNSFLQGTDVNSTFSTLVKEYFFTIEANVLEIDFIPRKGSFGFISALEVIQVVDQLFVDSVSKVGGNGVKSSLNLRERGVETMYRLNIGGPAVKPDLDSVFWRPWKTDSSYMLNTDAGSELRNKSSITYSSPNETSVAPIIVYETARTLSNTGVMERRFNMSWKLEVDADFDYLIRLHFCELLYNKSSQRNFRIYINNKTAADNFDIFVLAGGMNKAYHQDYFDTMPLQSDSLWVQLGPDITAGAAGTDALLSGLEVFKLSRDGNLARIQKYGNQRGKTISRTLVLWGGIVAGIVSIVLLAAIVLLILRYCRKPRGEQVNGKKSPGWRPSFLHGTIFHSSSAAKGYPLQKNTIGTFILRSGRRFTLAEIRAATNNFDETWVIGVGGFGKVYRGELEGSTLAAIKRANPQSQQGLKEFETEIEMLSKLRHRHLVAMIGFCDELNEMILVYEYMSNGTLRSHLFGCGLPPMSWKQRLEVCIGAARGLHYLHTGSERGIIHRDVKTTNILLDENFVAKMADFGLSKAGPSLEHTHVSTAVKGSFGYLDPEYFRLQRLTEKSDVYSFGVVLFEVVCARAVINPSLPKEQINLAEWALCWQKKNSLEKIIDRCLKGQYCLESFEKFADIAEKCLEDEGRSRPTMGEVLWQLESVLQIQESWEQKNDEESCGLLTQFPKEEDECEVQKDEEETNLKMKNDLNANNKEGESRTRVVKEEDHIVEF